LLKNKGKINFQNVDRNIYLFKKFYKKGGGKMKNLKYIIVFVIVVLIVGAGAFYTGMKYAQSKNLRFNNIQNLQNKQFQKRNTNSFQPLNGEVIDIQENTLTLKLSDNTSKIILLDSNTNISKTTKVTKDEIKVGEKIAVFGTKNSDGTLTAINININPSLRAGNMGNLSR
jgi:hypothetical protein